MKKTVFKMIIFTFSICTILMFSGCGKETKPIVGTWNYYDGKNTNSNIYYTFKEDMTGSYTFSGASRNFTYKDDGKTVTIKYEKDTNAGKYDYKIDKGILTIKDSFGSDVKYKKK